MVFWLAVIIGAVFAWAAVQIGFYGAWIMFFNLVLAAYMAVFLTPVVIDSIPAATAIPNYGCALTTLSIAVATLFISYGICYAVLSGQLRAPFPNVFDNVGAGLLGFLSGFLVCSFAALIFSLTPLADLDFAKSFGLDASSQTTNTSYVCWWGDSLHSFVAARTAQPVNGSEQVALLRNKAKPPVAATVEPAKTSLIEAVDAAKAAPVEPGTTATPENPLAAAPNPDEGQNPKTDRPPEGVNAAQPPSAVQNVGQPPSAVQNRGQQPRGQGKSWEEELGVSRAGTSATPTRESGGAAAARAVSPPGTTRTAPSAMPPAAVVGQTPATPPLPVVDNPFTSPDKNAPAGAVATDVPARPPEPQGPLTGLWRATSGALFRISDDGKTAVVKLWSSNFLQFMSGKLARSEGKADAKTLTGSLDTVFFIDAPKRYPIKVTATINDVDQLSLKCADWPKRWYRGKVVERGLMPEILTRAEEPPSGLFGEPPGRPIVPGGAAAPPTGMAPPADVAPPQH